jgi:hypothetical protein
MHFSYEIFLPNLRNARLHFFRSEFLNSVKSFSENLKWRLKIHLSRHFGFYKNILSTKFDSKRYSQSIVKKSDFDSPFLTSLTKYTLDLCYWQKLKRIVKISNSAFILDIRRHLESDKKTFLL